MEKLARIAFRLFAIVAILPSLALTQGREYPDGHGNVLYLPAGEISFADEVVSFSEGIPHAEEERFRRAKDIIGIPDMDYATEERSVSLGCGGSIIVRFRDNALVDVPGPDLYVFEIGVAIEPTQLAISKDGTNWIDVGEISGGRADVDISSYVQPGEYYYYVKLTDLKSGCGGPWPGADIDAVAAIGSAMEISLNSSVLFETAKHTLKPSAQAELEQAARKVAGFISADILIEGHTDNVGKDDANQLLSERRAAAVKTFFVAHGIEGASIKTTGYGESRPIATNETDEGKKNNRRVSIVVNPRHETTKHEYTALLHVYDRDKECAVNGYPRSIGTEFPGLWKDGVDEAINIGDGKIYFFRASNVMEFDLQTKTMSPNRAVSDAWPGVWKDGIDAAVNWKDGSVYLFKGDECVLYNVAAKKVESEADDIDDVFRGLWSSGIDAAVKYGKSKIYFFKDDEYMRYDIDNGTVDSGYPKEIKGNWTGLWSDDLTAFITKDENSFYVFKKFP